tara:strand:+ start:664 stop:1191 length:528 start_codon:yes stop_codon:yes gene_type:complete
MAGKMQTLLSKAAELLSKHADDIVTKPTAGQRKIRRATKAQRATRESARIAAGVGLGAGIAGAAVPTMAVLSKQLREAKTDTERAKTQAQIEKLMRKMQAEEAAKKPINKNSSAQNSVAANRDRLAKTQAAEKKAQAALDRSARLGDKGPDMKSKGGMASKTKMSYGGMSTKGKK